MPIRKAGRWVVTVSLDHEALKVYQGFTKGTKSAKVCSALLLYNVNQKKHRNEAAIAELQMRKIRRLEKDVRVANYRIECIQRGDSDPGDGPAVDLEVQAAAAKEENRSIRGGRF
jgi:hypothetical protein